MVIYGDMRFDPQNTKTHIAVDCIIVMWALLCKHRQHEGSVTASASNRIDCMGAIRKTRTFPYVVYTQLLQTLLCYSSHTLLHDLHVLHRDIANLVPIGVSELHWLLPYVMKKNKHPDTYIYVCMCVCMYICIYIYYAVQKDPKQRFVLFSMF